jgi:CRP/FNR family transcriptional regulator, cyclic AMP receptor protein
MPAHWGGRLVGEDSFVMHAWTDLIGYLGGFLLVLTFFMTSMIPLRITAICSSLAWLAYGCADTLYPIIVLHCVLLPLNTYRLWESLNRPR